MNPGVACKMKKSWGSIDSFLFFYLFPFRSLAKVKNPNINLSEMGDDSPKKRGKMDKQTTTSASMEPMEDLFGPKLLAKIDKIEATANLLKDFDFVAVYFSASWWYVP